MNQGFSYKATIKDIVLKDDHTCQILTDDGDKFSGNEFLLEKEAEELIGKRVKITATAKKEIIDILDLKTHHNLYKYDEERQNICAQTEEMLQGELQKGSRNELHYIGLEYEKNIAKQQEFFEKKLDIPPFLQRLRGLDEYHYPLTIDQMADLERYTAIHHIMQEGFIDLVMPEAKELAKEEYERYLRTGKAARGPKGYRPYSEFLEELQKASKYMDSSDGQSDNDAEEGDVYA